MKAFQIQAPGAGSLIDLPVPDKQNGVLLRVVLVGMCGTDLKTFQGSNAMVTFPRIPGHEVAAIVVENSSDLAAGTLVTLSPYSHCGECSSCQHRAIQRVPGQSNIGRPARWRDDGIHRRSARKDIYRGTYSNRALPRRTADRRRARRGRGDALPPAIRLRSSVVAASVLGRLRTRRFAVPPRLPSTWTTENSKWRAKLERRTRSTPVAKTFMNGWRH